MLLTTSLLATISIAAITDLRDRRIPNLVTVPACLAALAIRSFGGVGLVIDGFLGMGLALAVLLPLFALGGFGGGDVKLLAAVGAFLGPGGLLPALALTALFGGLLSVGAALRAGTFVAMADRTSSLTRYLATAGRRGVNPIATAPAPRSASIPYGVAILAGTLASLGVDRWL